MKMKTRTFMLGIVFAFIFAIGLVSAEVEFQDITVSPSPAQHNSQVALTFKLKNLGSGGATDVLTDIDLNAPFIFSGCSNSITSTSTATGFPSSLDLNEISGLITVLFNIPQHQQPCAYTGKITGSGTYTSGITFESNNINIPIGSSPTISIDSFTPPTQSQNGTLRLKNTGNVPLNNIAFSSSGNAQVSFTPSNVVLLPAGQNSQQIALSITNFDMLKFGLNPTTITATSAETSVTSSSFNVQKTFCKAGSVGGNLEITDIKIDNQGEGSDDEWQLLDVVEIEVQVDNNGDEDIDEVFVELGLFDSQGINQVNDLDFENADDEEIDVGKIKKGKDETVTFKFRIPADVDDGSYRLAVKAYDDDLGEEVECTDESNDLIGGDGHIFEDISIDRETDEGKFIAFENFILSPPQPTCGESVSFTTGVFNIGDEDQDQVRVNLINSQLGISDSVEIRNDLDQGDDTKVTFNFVIPNNVDDGLYQMRLSSEYDYRSGTYRESSDEDKIVPITIIGCTGTGGGATPPSTTRIASISARLDSDPIAGEELVVKSTITNLGTETKSFIVDAKDYNSWSELESVSERIVNLAPGASKDVTFRFNVDEDAEGEESFIIEVSSGVDFEAREVVLNIEGKQGSGSGITGAVIGFGDNAYLWIIGIINVILIILIIVVAVRISRR